MPEQPASERTEQPTPERMRKAREEGRVPQSREVPSAVMILVLLLALGMMASPLCNLFVSIARQGLSMDVDCAGDGTAILGFVQARGTDGLLAIAPFLLAALAASIAGSLLASGWAVSPKALAVKFERLNPVSGFKNLLSVRSAVNLLVSLVKLALILLIVWDYLQDKFPEILALRWAEPQGILAGAGRLIVGVVGRIAIGLIAVALADLLFQRWKHTRDLRMTRQEVKEERKQHEASPEVKGRIRAIQFQMARKRMLQAVPTADVVVANPTHVAVALKYDPATMEAPQVVAKGADFLCQKIREVARGHDIPIVERPELARMLYSTVEVGQSIPESLYVAVAEVLALIYRLGRRRHKALASPGNQ
jgi:flagellar biosynthetic protein FlhB